MFDPQQVIDYVESSELALDTAAKRIERFEQREAAFNRKVAAAADVCASLSGKPEMAEDIKNQLSHNPDTALDLLVSLARRQQKIAAVRPMGQPVSSGTGTAASPATRTEDAVKLANAAMDEHLRDIKPRP